jgi:hypothetical protein
MRVSGGGRIVGFVAVLVAALSLAAIHPARVAAEDGRIVVAQADDTPFFLRLFGFRKKEPEPRRSDGKVVKLGPGGRITEGTANAASGRAAPKPEVVVAPKNPDARRVLVIGDALAESLTRGLDVAFADMPGVRIEGAAVAGSGLAAREPVDWVARLGEVMAGANPADAVVVMMGLSDVRPIAVDGAETEFRSSKWEDVYRARFRSLLVAARSRNVPVFVVGLVPMADVGLTTDIAYLDDLYRQEAQAAFVTYLNVWNEFADETGGYTASGTDIGGQSRQLRLKDGVGFTKSGSRKLAFYVEQEIRAWIERGAPGLVMPQTSGDGLVMSLTDPEAGLDEDLVAPAATTEPKDGTPLHRLVVLGLPLDPVAGRVDDLSTVR